MLAMLNVAALELIDKLPPDTRALLMNIGSNIDPVIVDRQHRNSSVVIAFEPVVPHLIPPRPGLFVVPAAVSSGDDVTAMRVSGRSLKWVGSTSSLGDLEDLRSQYAAAPEGMDKLAGSDKVAGVSVRMVPVLSMRAVMKSLPSHVPFVYLKSDMQGYDFAALSSVGEQLLRAQFLRTEANFNLRAGYKNVRNDFCSNWLPHMTRLGFILRGVRGEYANDNASHVVSPAAAAKHCSDGKPFAFVEADAYWASPQRSVARPPVRKVEWPFSPMRVTQSREGRRL